MRSISLLLFVLVFTGCSSISDGPKFSGLESKPKSDESVLYIYRPDSYYGKAITVPVLLNGKKIADLGNEGYFSMTVPAGEYTIQPDSDSIDHEFSFNAKAGAGHFLRLKVNRKPAICFCSSLEFELAEESAALTELTETRLETDRVYGF